MKILSASEVKETGLYWWRSSRETHWMIVRVMNRESGDVQALKFRWVEDAFWNFESLHGEFVGPIEAPNSLLKSSSESGVGA